PILHDRALPHALDLARQWLAACENKHSCCRQPSNGFLPDRLLEVTDDSIKLRVKPQKAEPYVALSHCWGSTKPIVLSMENLSSFQEGFSWTDLPQTFKEAAQITQNLGFRFIWIDTLCIIQDNEEDWEEQSTLMASIYGNATLVLAASAAKSTEDGFLMTKNDSPTEARLKLARNEHHQSIDRYLRIRVDAFRFNRRGPLDGRAWAYQEEAVSKRYLAYAESGMEWSCTQTRYSEIGQYLPMREIGRPANLINLFNSCLDTDTLRAYWSTELIVSYKGRKLTVQSDILLALSAIAKEFQAKTKWTYLAGLWKEDLISGLAWVCIGDILPAPGPQRGTSQNKYEQKYCPSWSWASVDNNRVISTESASHPRERYSEAVATVVQAYTLTAPMSPFGLVHDGLVVLRG
ncbi:heterokaryon incompatibility protein-domain-containing protein, partial [Pestalotiopsis sp. NC0098]